MQGFPVRDGESYIRRMENDNRFALDARLGDLVVCLIWTDMSDDEIIPVCLYLKEYPSVCSRLMTYLECGDRCSSEVLSFLAIADGLKMETGMPRIIREHAEEFSKG